MLKQISFMGRNSDQPFRKILVTGANGQLGSELQLLAVNYKNFEFCFTDIETLNISNSEAVNSYLHQYQPDIIVNCAAYTAVDKAEEEREKVTLINATAPAILADSAKSIGAMLIHISTDYVFDGKSWIPYSENHKTSPNSAYGKSKLNGEIKALESGVCMVIRTSWLYSSFGNNFLKTILKKGKEQKELNVVFDQVGCPTWANDLARAILSIIEMGKNGFKPEIFHYSNEGVCSWYDFAKEIALMGDLNCKINAILSSQYKMAASRPPYSVLDKTKIKLTYGIEIPHWRESLAKCMKSIIS